MPTSTTTPTDPSTGATEATLEQQALGALIDVIKSGTSPDIAQAEAIMLRRLALQGDVVPSRVPPPRNITEVGGYINLLATLQQPELRAQVLAGILGVAGPNPPLGWSPSLPPLSWVTLDNDRPAGTAQPAIPLTFSVRSDFATPLQVALKTLHDQGCALPLLSPRWPLPQGTLGAHPPDDALPYLGRTLDVVPTAALVDPDADPLALARQGTDPYQLVARVLSPGSVAVTAGPWDALACTATACTSVPAPGAGRQYVPVAPLLANAGFYQTSPLPQPATASDLGWAHFTNVTGLVTGKTTLGDELTLLYSTTDIASSVFASRMYWVWNGTKFVASL